MSDVTIQFQEDIADNETKSEARARNSTRARLFLALFTPSRHMGKCNPNDRHSTSPSNDIWFATTMSMQNFQILTGTVGVAKYIVKYVTKLDDGNGCVVFADAHTSAITRVGDDFLQKTKIATSSANEEKKIAKARHRKHPTGRDIALVEVLHHMLG